VGSRRTRLMFPPVELVLELDLLCDGDAVLGHARRSKGFLEHTTLRPLGAQRHLDRVGQNVDASEASFAAPRQRISLLWQTC
jgi:hypothetical protein